MGELERELQKNEGMEREKGRPFSFICETDRTTCLKAD